MQVWGMGPHPVYLWTLPMFHCNGWCFPWTVTALAGTHVCLRQVRAEAIYDAIADHGVTHLCGAPNVIQLLLGTTAEEKRHFVHKATFMTAEAPPPAAVLAAMHVAGIEVELQCVVQGQSVAVRVDLGGIRIIPQKQLKTKITQTSN